VQSYADFYERKTEFENWLKQSNNTLSSHSNHELDEKRVKANFDVINILQNKFISGEKLIGELQENYKKILFAYPDDEHLELQDTFSRTQDSWNNYLLCIQTVSDNLKLKLRQWEIFNENKRNFVNWLNDTTSKLNETTDSSIIELSDMKAKLERLRNTQKIIDEKKYDLNELNETVEKISKDQVLEEFEQLQGDYTAVKQKCDTKLNEVEQDIEEFTEYNSNLQEIEKWLLQMSFQLMAHNSLYIMNTSQALEQISQHDFILTNIQNFQQNIDQLKQKGHMVVERFAQKSSHNIQHTIDIQLANIQESYNSLLNTSIQIKNRLTESLKKFQEYENALANIDKKLDEYEILINDLIQQTGQDLKEAQRLYNSAQDIYKNLLKEKEFLATAVHSYEAAKACISRPSSPLDAQSQIVPEKELLTRARLEDCLDQIHTFMTDLAVIVEKLENSMQQKDDMLKWMAEKQFILNDLNSSPTKLHLEAANQEIKQVKDFLQDLSDARRKFLDNLDDDTNESEKLFNEMEGQATQLLLKKQKEQAAIDNYRRLYDTTQNFINEQNKSLDMYEKGCKYPLDEKITKINRIKNDATQYSNNQLPKIADMVKQITGMVSNIDKNQINDQHKAMEKRFVDLRNRIDRKLNSLESSKNHLNALQNDLLMESSWVNHQLEEATSFNPVIFTDSKSIEEHLHKLKTVLREIESKSLSLGSYANRIMNLEKDMEKSEIAELEQKLKHLQKKHDSLSTKLNGDNQKLMDALNKYKAMEAAVESAKNQMQLRVNDIQRQLATTTYLPLLCSNIDTEISKMEKLERENEEFRKKSLVNIERQIDEIINAVQNDSPNETNRDAIKQMDTYKNELSRQWDSVNDIIDMRKTKLQKHRECRAIFEEKAHKLKIWLDETDAATEKMFVNPTKKINVLMDQKLCCEKLINEFTTKEPILEILKDSASKISPTVSDADRKMLETELKSLQKRFKKRKQAVKDRIQSLDDNVTKMQDAFAKIQQCLETMKQVKERINTASSDTSCSTEKINNLLSIYETSLQLLRDQKLSVASIVNLEIPDISNILHQLEEMIREIEKLLDRLKYLLALRSEFIAAVNSIVQLIQKQNMQVTTIEGSTQMNHKQKCHEYEILRDQMNDCDQLLQTAKEKGQQIVACGSDIDKNNVDGQINTLDEQIEQLKQIIFNNCKAHQQLYDVQQQLSKALKDILKWFDDEEANIKLVPALKINKKQPNYVVNLIKDYEKLQNKANQRLDEIRQIVVKLKKHAPNDIFPEELSVQVSQAQSLQATIPREMSAKTSFLQDCLECRKKYQDTCQEFDIWISDAGKKLPDTMELDFKKIKHLLDSHKQFFYPKTEEQFLNDIEALGKLVKISMNNDSSAALMEEIDNYKQNADKLTTQAKEFEQKLERADEDWQKYNSMLEQINVLLLDENIKRWDDKEFVMRDLADVNHHIDSLIHTIDDMEKNSYLIEDLNVLFARLVENADSKNSEFISNQTNRLEQNWTNTILHLQKILDKLKHLSKNWHEFDKLVKKLMEIQTSLFNDFDNIDDKKVESLNQLLSDKQKISNFDEKLQLSEPIRSSIKEFHKLIHPHSMVTNEQIVKKLDVDNDRLKIMFDKKLQKLDQEMEKIKDNLSEIDSMKKLAGELLSKVDRFDPYEKYTEEMDQEFVTLQQTCQNLKLKADQIIKSISKTYLDVQNYVPSDLQCELDNLVIVLNQLMAQLNEKTKCFNEAKKMKQHFLDSLTNMKNWLENSEVKIENHNYPLEDKKTIIVQIRDEYDTLMSEDCKNLFAEGNRLKESCGELDEQDITRMLQEITTEMECMERNINSKYDEVEKALDLRRKFLIYYNDILEWAMKVESFTMKPLHCQSLNEIRGLCENYTVSSNRIKCRNIRSWLICDYEALRFG
jgi:nesprin-1